MDRNYFEKMNEDKYTNKVANVSAPPGQAKLKPEFLTSDHGRQVNLDFVASKDKEEFCSKASEDSERNEQPDQDSGPPRKKLKGQNKKRPREVRLRKDQKLCLKLLTEDGCSYADKCCFSHDITSFVTNRLPDLGQECYLFETFGRCPYAFKCRYGSKHLDPDFKNIVKPEIADKFRNQVFETNGLNKDLQFSLRKRNYDFSTAEKVLKVVLQNLQKSSSTSQNQRGPGNDAVGTVDVRPLGAVSDEDIIKLRPCEKKKITFKDKLYLAPLTTVGNLPFRRLCKEFGAEVTCGEMAMGTNLLQGQQSEWALLKRHSSEDLFGVQVCGAHADQMTRLGQVLCQHTDVDFIDINLGCPIDLVFQKGAGCGLMNRLKKLEEIVFCMSSVLSVPLTVKMRTGVYSQKNTADSLIAKIRDWPTGTVQLITLHGRSREQRYTRSADWDYIKTCVSRAGPIPLFGCGDILSYEDYNLRKESSGVSGIMLARGALIKPWIFTEIKEQRHWDISSQERLDILKRYVNYGLEHWGSDTEGVEKTRRFLLEWLSFLYRYIPVGILECPPQKINERPPSYKGRDPLETLMASSNCGDWLKISELLLGPTPEEFVFLPKHKANAYQ